MEISYDIVIYNKDLKLENTIKEKLLCFCNNDILLFLTGIYMI
jgi:hypothetical protein